MKKLKKILITLLVIILFTIGGLIVESIFNNSNKKYSNVTYAKSINTTSDMQLMARAINGEARGEPYEGQVAVGAVVLNRVKSSVYPNSVSEVIYQSGQFSPAMSGWLDRVRANAGYSESALQAAEDALNGSNPVGDCLYFSTGGYGMQIGDHFFH